MNNDWNDEVHHDQTEEEDLHGGHDVWIVHAAKTDKGKTEKCEARNTGFT